MCVLSDRDIEYELQRGYLRIDGCPCLGQDGFRLHERLQPASVDVTIGHLVHPEMDSVMETRRNADGDLDLRDIGCFVLYPGENCLLTTHEWFRVPPSLSMQFDGRSHLARKFITVHDCAGWCDPGYEGSPTAEVRNNAQTPWMLRLGEPLGQVFFQRLTSVAERPYGPMRDSHYQGDMTPKGSWR